MTEQQKIIFEGACRLSAGLLESGAIKLSNDPDRQSWNKYCVEKAWAIYNETINRVK